jgi:hypothetical protein
VTRRGTCIALALVLAALGVPGPGGAAEPIRAGIGKADLTWRVGASVPGGVTDNLPSVAGQDVPADPLRFAGLHSRPSAKAIVVDAGEPFVFARADILLVTGDLYEAVAVRVEEATGIPPERLLLAATHTHVANNGLFPHPAHGALYRSFDPREQLFIADGIASAVVAATKNMRPAMMAAGSGSVTLPSLNRRHTAAEQDNEPPFGNDISRLDPELGVIRFDDAETGAPLATIMNYGLHPVVLIDNPLVSTDFVGLAERALEREVGGTAIWFTGAQGDQDPIYVRYSYPEAEWTANIFAAEAARVARGLVPEPLTRAAIAEKVVPLPPPGGEPLASSEIVRPGTRLPLAGPASLLIPTSVRLHAIELSTAASSTALLSWPGEPIRDLGVGLKDGARALGFDRAFVLALANDWAGYWLTPEEFDRGLYERTLMFYGRESAAYVTSHVLELADSLSSGAAVTQVPLPPNAAADRVVTETLARAGMASGEEVQSLFVALPESGAPIALAQPAATMTRPGVVSFEWRGGHPDVAHDWIPRVTVERSGAPVAQEGTGEVLLFSLGGTEWRAVWETLPSTPAGMYRFVVDGQRATAGGQEAFTLASDEFEVTACSCISAAGVSVTGTLVRVAATYGPVLPLAVPHVANGFRLQPGRVTTGTATVEVLDGDTVIDTLTLPFVSRIEAVARTVTVSDVSGFDLPVTIVEPTEVGAFETTWSGASGVTFRLVGVVDGFGNAA